MLVTEATSVMAMTCCNKDLTIGQQCCRVVGTSCGHATGGRPCA